MENSTEVMDTKSDKVDIELPPPAYSEVVQKYSVTNSPVLKFESLPSSPALSEKENPMFDKMVHLETLCTSMHTMLEFQNHAYLDVKGQLSQMSRSARSHADDPNSQNSRIKQKLAVMPGAEKEHPPDPVSCDSTIRSDVSECDDSGFDRVCNMLEHLLSDAKTAIDKRPEEDEVSYHEESDEELASSASLVSPIRDNFPVRHHGLVRKSNTISTSGQNIGLIPEVDELKIWCQFVRNGVENQPYDVRCKMFLPNLGLTLGPHLDGLDLCKSKTTKFTNDNEIPVDSQPVLFSVVYWSLCFVLGVLLLDRYLIELASRQITLTIESLLPGPRIDFGNPPLSRFDDDDVMSYCDHDMPIRRNSM